MPRKKKTVNKTPDAISSQQSQMFSGLGASTVNMYGKTGAWSMERKMHYRHSGDPTVSLSPGNVIRNQFFSGDGTDPVKSLHRLQEIFNGKLEKDVVQLVFSECGYNVEQSLETLFMLMPEKDLPKPKDKNWKYQQPTTSTSGMTPHRTQSFKYTGAHLGLRGGGNEGLSLKHLQTFSGTRKSNWNTISVSSDSSSDCASIKDYDSSDSRHMRMNQQQFADVIYHKSDKDRSVYNSNSSINNISQAGPKNISATGFTFTVNSESKFVDSIFSSKNAIDDTINLIHSSEKVLIILRGLPGSGKTTLARQLNYNGAIFSTDDYFITNNVYKFEPYLLTEAHEWNKARAHSALEDSLTPVIIDNTNIESWQIKPYVTLGIKFNYKIVILEPNTLWKFNVSELARRNSHSVTKEKISRMLERYEHGITVETFGLGYTPNNSLSYNPNIIQPNSGTPIVSECSISLTSVPISKDTRSPSPWSKDENQNRSSSMLDVQSNTPELKSKLSDTSSKTSLSSENVDNSSNSSQTSEGLKPPDTHRLELADFMALAQQESEDSLSVSRRTSASSSQDASGWEYDEEFLWSGDESRIHNRYPSHNNNLVAEDILEEPESTQCEDGISNQTAPLKSDFTTSKSHQQTQPLFQWNAPKIAVTNTSSSLEPHLENTQQRSSATCSLMSNWSIPSSPVRENSLEQHKTVPEKNSDLCSKSCPTVLSSDWSIPSYPITNQDTNQSVKPPVDQNIPKVVLMCSLTSQTTSADFLELYTISRGGSTKVNPEVKVLVGHLQESSSKNVPVTQTPNQTVPMSPVFDKSTTTEGLESDLGKDKKLGMLQSMFPYIALADLEDILDKCHGDQEWAVNLLIDFGQEFNDQNCQKPLPFLFNKNNSLEKPKPQVIEETDKGKNSNTDNNNTTTKGKDVITDRLVLMLEPAFAMQLEELFGTVGFHVDPESLTSEDLQVSLDIGLAKEIHTLWKDTLSSRFSTNSSTRSLEMQFGGDQSPSKSCTPSSYSAAPVSSVKGQGQDVPSLAEIMSMEAALEARRLELLKAPNSNADALATKLGRNELYALFPGIDRIALDEMYQANNYKLSLTLLCLRETLGDGASGGLWLSEEMAKQTEEELCKLATQASMEGAQLDPDWTTWVADLTGEDVDSLQVLASTQVQPVANYEDLRAEATLHYKQRQECIHKSVEAYQRGMKAVASFYAQRGRLHFQKLKEANQRASEKIQELRNESMDSNSLDLHGLYVSEALQALQVFLEKKELEFRRLPVNRLVLYVITGRGIHSAKSVGPKLRPAIIDYLQRENYRFESVQDGLLKITLT